LHTVANAIVKRASQDRPIIDEGDGHPARWPSLFHILLISWPQAVAASRHEEEDRESPHGNLHRPPNDEGVQDPEGLVFHGDCPGREFLLKH
jgi:hypothetical protein